LTNNDGGSMATNEVRFTVSPQLYAYLEWLKDNTVLGRTENEVAQQVLTQRLTEMRGERYRDRAES
jgi:hypothetical protein